MKALDGTIKALLIINFTFSIEKRRNTAYTDSDLTLKMLSRIVKPSRMKTQVGQNTKFAKNVVSRYGGHLITLNSVLKH